MRLVAVHDVEAEKGDAAGHTFTLLDGCMSAPDANEQAFALVSGSRSSLKVQRLRQIEQEGAAEPWPDDALRAIEQGYPEIREFLKQVAQSGKRVRFRAQIQVDIEG